MAEIVLIAGEGEAAMRFGLLEFMSFPGGERHVRLPVQHPGWAMSTAEAVWAIEARIYTPADIMDLLLTHDALKRALPAGVRLSLVLPYVPYARQDRVAVAGEPLSIKVFCGLINAMGFASVEIWDPHSDVTPALLDNVVVAPTPQLMINALAPSGNASLLRTCAFVAPDAGARKRVSELAKHFKTEVVFAEKVRDPVTGKLSGAQVQGTLPERPLLIVDDICDGGGTFIQLAQALREQTSQPLYLYVTHGLFTKGIEVLQPYFKGIFAANIRA